MPTIDYSIPAGEHDSGEGAFLEMTKCIYKYVLSHLKEQMFDIVRSYRAVVTTAPANGVVGVTRPFDNEIFMPYVSSMADGLSVGTNVMVMVLGEPNSNLRNAFVFTNMTLSNL